MPRTCGEGLQKTIRRGSGDPGNTLISCAVPDREFPGIRSDERDVHPAAIHLRQEFCGCERFITVPAQRAIGVNGAKWREVVLQSRFSSC